MRKFEGFQKGVNLGGWISQFRKYDKAHFDSYITEEDIRKVNEQYYTFQQIKNDLKSVNNF